MAYRDDNFLYRQDFFPFFLTEINETKIMDSILYAQNLRVLLKVEIGSAFQALIFAFA